MLKSAFGTACLLGLAGMLVCTGCSSNNSPGTIDGSGAHEGATGGVDLALLLADGSDVGTVNYVITRDGIGVRTGTLAIGADGRASGTVTGLDVGDGYVVSLEAARTRDAGEVRSCTGESAPFTVIEHGTILVSVVLQCDDTSTSGNIAVNGQFNVCPKVTSATATPITQAVGSTIALSASASDKDGDVLTYDWFVGATYSESAVFASAQTATFTCNAIGTVPIKVAAYDGDAHGCRRALRAPLYVTCTATDYPPPTVACNTCLTANCNPQFGFIFLIDDCVDAACDAVFNCFQRNRCAVDTLTVHKCYCGDVTVEACRAPGFDATGPCANLVEQGLGTTVASEVIERFVDRDTATGDGIALFGCAAENCIPECLTSAAIPPP